MPEATQSVTIYDEDGILTPIITSGLGFTVSEKALTGIPSQSLDFLDLTGAATLSVNEYIAAQTYSIPVGFAFSLLSFSAFAGNGNNIARVAEVINFGSFNTSTNVYTDSGFSAATPKFYGALEAQVTTALSATATTLTITYVNQGGVGGRTATAVIPASAVLNRRIRATLQAGDTGVQDVTNVTDSANPTGVVRIQGVNALSVTRMTSADQMYTQTYSNNSVMIQSANGVTIQNEYATRTGTVATPRGLTTVFELLPINT